MHTIKFFLFALFLLVCDQLSKTWVLLTVDSEGFQVAPFLDFTLVWNKGISYGWLSNWQTAYTHEMLIGVNVLITCMLLFCLSRTFRLGQRIALSLIIGGALGNVCDRILYGSVVDFISFHIYGYYWYVFNLADVWITLGAIGLIVFPFYGQKQTSCVPL